LAQLKTFEPDLVILDLNLPGIKWIRCVQPHQEIESGADSMLSVNEDQSDKVEALDLGADDLIGRAEFLAHQVFQRVDQVPLEEGPLKACNVLGHRVSGHRLRTPRRLTVSWSNGATGSTGWI
jgi:PleD family two-component response regulator